MTTLTAEQEVAAEKMSLEELRQAAIKESQTDSEAALAASVIAANQVEADKLAAARAEEAEKKRTRNSKGRFASSDNVETLLATLSDEDKKAVHTIHENSSLTETQKEEQVAALIEEAEDDPQIFVMRREIENGVGSTDVYEGEGATESEALNDLVEKIAEGKRQANIQMQKINAERRTERIRTAQEIRDENYVIEQNLKTKPKETIEQIVEKKIAEKTASAQRSSAAESRFVLTHPDYNANPKTGNGDRLVAEFVRLYPTATEFTSEGLEKAYQSLKTSGLLTLKTPEADEATKAAQLEAERTAQAQRDAALSRSPRRSSTISARSSTTAPVKTDVAPTEDELYKMPLAELKKLADQQLAKQAADRT